MHAILLLLSDYILLALMSFSSSFFTKPSNFERMILISYQYVCLIAANYFSIRAAPRQWPASVAQLAETQAHRPGRSVGEAGVQSPGRPVDFVFGFQGACFEINFSGRQRGFDGVLYNL